MYKQIGDYWMTAFASFQLNWHVDFNDSNLSLFLVYISPLPTTTIGAKIAKIIDTKYHSL